MRHHLQEVVGHLFSWMPEALSRKPLLGWQDLAGLQAFGSACLQKPACLKPDWLREAGLATHSRRMSASSAHSCSARAAPGPASPAGHWW